MVIPRRVAVDFAGPGTPYLARLESAANTRAPNGGQKRFGRSGCAPYADSALRTSHSALDTAAVLSRMPSPDRAGNTTHYKGWGKL